MNNSALMTNCLREKITTSEFPFCNVETYYEQRRRKNSDEKLFRIKDFTIGGGAVKARIFNLYKLWLLLSLLVKGPPQSFDREDREIYPRKTGRTAITAR